ncbi:hypothetical protein NL676_023057 [Syzygium grande]|nr:hypothetical protein NL676_023057 [Syzygium grande]
MIESILQKAYFALGKEEEQAVKLGMLEIKKRVEAINETIEDLHAQAGKSSGVIRVAARPSSTRGEDLVELHWRQILDLGMLSSPEKGREITVVKAWEIKIILSLQFQLKLSD